MTSSDRRRAEEEAPAPRGGAGAAATAAALPAGLREPLARTLARGRLAPAYLIEGGDAAAVRSAALALAAAVLCPEGRLGCGCASCARVRAGTHRDLHRLRRDKPTVISVAALEPVLARAHSRPVEGPRQVFVVEPADALEPEGVARYLKSLEEPPEGTLFLLLTTRPERLPDAVRSRCQRLGVPPLTEDEVRAALLVDGLGAAEAAGAARAATGSLTRARRLAAAEVPARLLDLWQAAASGGPVAARTVDGVLAALTAAAPTAVSADDRDPTVEEGASHAREALRVVLGDLLHALGVEGREAAAGRPVLGGATLAPEAGLTLLEAAASLSAATASNVSPVVILLEVLRALRAAAGR